MSMARSKSAAWVLQAAFCWKFARKVALVTCPYAFRLRRLAQLCIPLLGPGIFSVNSRIKWLLSHDCAGSRKLCVPIVGPGIFPENSLHAVCTRCHEPVLHLEPRPWHTAGVLVPSACSPPNRSNPSKTVLMAFATPCCSLAKHIPRGGVGQHRTRAAVVRSLSNCLGKRVL